MRANSLPFWSWLLPAAAAIPAVLAWILGVAAGVATFLAAGLGYYLHYRPFG